MSLNTTQDTWEFIHYVFETLGVSELSDCTTLTWSSRLTSTGGTGGYSLYINKGRIKLSSVLWKHATQADRIKLVIHEACHVVQRYLYPYSKPHGHEWKRLMRRCGLTPERCHSINTSACNYKRQ